jgi:hypothetical protein
LLRAGHARRVPDEDVENEGAVVLKSRLCRSNDIHVIALARLSGARTLCTRDRYLERDFKNVRLVSKPKGSIYKGSSHARLLRHTSSCGLLKKGRKR